MIKFERPIDEAAVKIAPSHPVQIYIAGDYNQARNACKRFCNERGLCVTVTPTTYIYTGGEQQGVIVELINYPRFPMKIEIDDRISFDGKREHTHIARCLGTYLCGELFQESFSIQDPDDTEWRSYRKEDLANEGRDG